MTFTGTGAFDNRPETAPGYHRPHTPPVANPEHHPRNRRAGVSSIRHWNGTWMACAQGPLVGVMLRLVVEHQREAA